MLVHLVSWALCGAAMAADSWEQTVEAVAPAVVSIKVTSVRDFDTERASNSQGTGFVVDADRGLILTNRHMVHSGPVRARAIFLNNEEVDLEPIYRDPVHDFGVYRFDPDALEYLDLTELELVPDAAKVGMQIRVVGNDAGEKLSILDATLARLDRNAPRYGGNTYNDFNTFYYQAASNTSGGSSGSPVIDVEGQVVALNAGGSTRAASSYYLPLHRVERALELIQQGEVVPRGSIQTTFEHVPYEELNRLKLTGETERRVRDAVSDPDAPEAGGMLVVKNVSRGGPADKKLRAGDVLVELDGELVTGFVGLERRLDAAVGKTVRLSIERLGEAKTVSVEVDDLHSISPSTYLEVGHGVVHDLSYQQARNHEVPLGTGVYVASAGYMLGAAGVQQGHLILQVGDTPTPTLDAFQDAIEGLPDQARVRVRAAPVSNIKNVFEVVVQVDRTWFPMRRCTRDDSDGLWPCDERPKQPARASVAAASVPLPVVGDRLVRKVAPSLVLVDFDVPYSTAGVRGQYFVGTGVVVDADQGLVLVDRDTVPVALGDLTLTFAGAVRVPGEVVWLHPVHNYAFVRYDPESLGDLDVRAVKLSNKPMPEEGKVVVVGLDSDGGAVSDQAEVSDFGELNIPASGTPRFRDVNIEAAGLDQVERSVGGVVVDRSGAMLALWASFLFPVDKEGYFYALPVRYIERPLAAVRAGEEPEVWDAGVEFRMLGLADARERGLSDARIREYLKHDPKRLELLEVSRVSGDAPADDVVRPTDLVVLADGEPVSRIGVVDTWSGRSSVPLVVLRDGAEVEVDLPLERQDGTGVRRIVSWSGLLLHEPHREVATQRRLSPDGVYVAWYWYGSPGSRDGVRPTWRVTAFNEDKIDDLDDFLAAAIALPDGEPAVLTVENLDETMKVRAVEPDDHYWPTEVIEWQDGKWTRRRVD